MIGGDYQHITVPAVRPPALPYVPPLPGQKLALTNDTAANIRNVSGLSPNTTLPPAALPIMIRGLHCFQCRGGAYQDTMAISRILVKPGSVRIVSSCWCWQRQVFDNSFVSVVTESGDSGTGDHQQLWHSTSHLRLEDLKYLHTVSTTTSQQGETFKEIRKRLSTFTFPISYWTFLAALTSHLKLCGVVVVCLFFRWY